MRIGSENVSARGGRPQALAAKKAMHLRVVLVLLLAIVGITTTLSSLRAMLSDTTVSSPTKIHQVVVEDILNTYDETADDAQQNHSQDIWDGNIASLDTKTSSGNSSKSYPYENGSFIRRPKQPGSFNPEIFFCDRSHPRTDVCTMRGDVRMDGKSASFMLYSTSNDTPVAEEKIKPYTRKWEKSCMDIVHEVTLKSIRANNTATNNTVPICDIYHSVPAIVFSTGGYTGNLYHEFNDGLIPLFITSQYLKRDVAFIIIEFHPWWLMKYEDIINQLSKYPVVDFDNDHQIHCFPEITVGLHIHEELGIHPNLMPQNETVLDFRNILDRAYKDNASESGGLPFSKKPRMVIIVRYGTRIFQNLDEIVALAEEVGFNVTLWKPDPTTELKKIYWTLNSSEVLMGVHGAAMTHFLFMRPGSIFVQIVPLGTKYAADTYYGDPAKKLGLQYLEYLIKPEESSLSDKYPKNDTVLTNPEQIVNKGWWDMKEVYLEHQDVRPSLPRLQKTLIKAKARALRYMKLHAG